jgi:hypothetical protein
MRKEALANSDESFFGVFPRVTARRVHDFVGTNGIKGLGEPCGRCGGCFLNVVCPVHWPIETIALVCFTCGSTMDYVDNLLMLEVKEAMRIRVQRPWVIDRGAAKQVESSVTNEKVLGEIIEMGVAGGLSDQDIAEVLEMDPGYISDVASFVRKR